MDAAIEVCGLASLVVAGFLASTIIGFTIVGAALLWIAWRRAKATK